MKRINIEEAIEEHKNGNKILTFLNNVLYKICLLTSTFILL
jgi:hypothetical protein